jgi:hypothetical protein
MSARRLEGWIRVVRIGHWPIGHWEFRLRGYGHSSVAHEADLGWWPKRSLHFHSPGVWAG